MRLYEQRDDKGTRKKSGHAKQMRQFKHRAERRAARLKLDEHAPTYKRYRGFAL